MSDVIVLTNDPITTVTTEENVVQIDVTNNVVQIAQMTAGIQGATGPQGSVVDGAPLYVIVTNKTGSTLPKGSIVYTSGANGIHTQVSLALATSDATSARALGWLKDAIANNADGLCMVEGYLDGVNTQGIAEGSQLYLSGTVPGGFTATKPQAPIHLVYVGVAAKASAGNGRVYVKVQNGYELGELHDVLIVSPTNNDVLTYDSSTSLWKNSKTALRYTHIQGAALASWTITHNLGYVPSITIIDSGGNEVEGNIVYNDLNVATVSFTSEISGSAYLS
jgi:hypothetical protein